MGGKTIDTLAEKANLTRVGNERAADEIEKGCLPRPIGPHHAEDLAGFNGQADILDSSNTAKTLGDSIESEKRHETSAWTLSPRRGERTR